MAKGASKVDQVLDIIKEMTILELRDLNQKIQDDFGITAAAPVAMAAAPAGAPRGRRWRGPGRSRGREDRVHGRPQGYRREQDQRDQSGERGDDAGAEGGKGPGRSVAGERKGRNL